MALLKLISVGFLIRTFVIIGRGIVAQFAFWKDGVLTLFRDSYQGIFSSLVEMLQYSVLEYKRGKKGAYRGMIYLRYKEHRDYLMGKPGFDRNIPITFKSYLHSNWGYGINFRESLRQEREDRKLA